MKLDQSVSGAAPWSGYDSMISAHRKWIIRAACLLPAGLLLGYVARGLGPSGFTRALFALAFVVSLLSSAALLFLPIILYFLRRAKLDMQRAVKQGGLAEARRGGRE